MQDASAYASADGYVDADDAAAAAVYCCYMSTVCALTFTLDARSIMVNSNGDHVCASVCVYVNKLYVIVDCYFPLFFLFCCMLALVLCMQYARQVNQKLCI